MPQAPAMVRARSAKFLVGLLAMLATLVPASPASATSGDGWHAGGLVNETRWWADVAPLTMDEHLSGVAQGWAERMAARGRLAHNPGLRWAMDGWWAWGENVGYGPSIDAVHGGFAGSGSHYANLVDPAFTHIGVGVAYDEWGWVYVVQVFGG